MSHVVLRRLLAVAVAVTVAALGLAVGPGCERKGSDRHAASQLLHSPKPVPPDVGRAASDPGVLVAAALRPWRDGARALGAHTFLGTHTLELREGSTVLEKLDEKTSLLAADDGALAVRYSNDRGYGRELYFRPATPQAGALIWVRPGFGKFHRRPPAEEDEPWRVADETFATLAADLELAQSGLGIEDGGAVTHLGRPARKIRLVRGKARSAPKEKRPERAWRETIVVDALAGELILDDATGALLDGRLDAAVTFERDGKRLTLQVSGTHAVADLGARIAPTWPADAESVDTPRRTTEFAERTELLDGLAAPPRKAPMPGEDDPDKEPKP